MPHRFIPACAGNTNGPRCAVTSTVHPRVRGEHASLGGTENVAGSSPRARGILDTSRQRQSLPTVHPRVRGEHTARRRVSASNAGSSPRARGTRFTTVDEPLRPPVHPRVRGEHDRVASVVTLGIGSSPRARGTLQQSGTFANLRRRFIPACAGNTTAVQWRCEPPPVHPRVRGEHGRRMCPTGATVRFIPACAGNTAGAAAVQSTKPGSSPRARGTPSNDAFGGAENRFIPACAGNTIVGSPTKALNSVHPRVRGEHRPRSAAIWLRSVHPRVRGEHLAQARTAIGGAGSSPRARGTRRPPGGRAAARRFIPACAGNTAVARRGLVTEAVHPRVRGEHGRRCNSAPLLLAVHPRVRGEHRNTNWSPARVGAGSSPRARGTRSRLRPPDAAAAVHPRVRGEHCRSGVTARRRSGSSPRARGTRHHWLQRRRIGRFIPACAGNTVEAVTRAARRPVHPRVRGEHGHSANPFARMAVHPRVRGEHGRQSRLARWHSRFIPACAGNTRPASPRRRRLDRFIPACAGNTSRSPAQRHAATVHPRVRGEHADRLRDIACCTRFIPACAGNTAATAKDSSIDRGSSPRARGTRWRGRAMPIGSVHPRVRGEHVLDAVLDQHPRRSGSSPRARGTRHRAQPIASMATVHPRVRGEHDLARGSTD